MARDRASWQTLDTLIDFRTRGFSRLCFNDAGIDIVILGMIHNIG